MVVGYPGHFLCLPSGLSSPYLRHGGGSPTERKGLKSEGQGWAALEGGHLRVILGMALQNDCGGPWHSGGLGGLEVCMCACPPFSGCFSGLPEEIIYKQATDR